MEWSSIPLAFAAGVLSLISPCVLPLIPVVTSSAIQSSKAGLLALILGIVFAFASAGTLLTFILLNLGLSPDIMRYFSAALMLLMAALLLIPFLSNIISNLLSRLTGRVDFGYLDGHSAVTQGFIGLSLGLVWLPCVGPTLGTAIALASSGQNMLLAFIVMLSFGAGTALPLIWIGYRTGLQFASVRNSAVFGKKLLGVSLLLIATLIITGGDRVMERWAMSYLPDWVTSI